MCKFVGNENQRSCGEVETSSCTPLLRALVFGKALRSTLNRLELRSLRLARYRNQSPTLQHGTQAFGGSRVSPQPRDASTCAQATLRLINAKGRTREDAGEDPKDAKFKKELCRYFENGHCDKGQHCSFAHGPSELRGAGSQARFKMDLCDFFARGYCVKGENCTYAHGPAELCIAGSSSPERLEPSPPNFKRHICTYYEKGQCDKGNKCTFAHGFAELRAGKGPGKGVHKGPSWERGPEAAPANAWRARKVI
ncbi:unnamed protein product [Effrenium voratum]|nr:unnamed protein product [Effrenium voratum]